MFIKKIVHHKNREYFTSFTSDSYVDFEQENVRWEGSLNHSSYQVFYKKISL